METTGGRKVAGLPRGAADPRQPFCARCSSKAPRRGWGTGWDPPIPTTMRPCHHRPQRLRLCHGAHAMPKTRWIPPKKPRGVSTERGCSGTRRVPTHPQGHPAACPDPRTRGQTDGRAGTDTGLGSRRGGGGHGWVLPVPPKSLGGHGDAPHPGDGGGSTEGCSPPARLPREAGGCPAPPGGVRASPHTVGGPAAGSRGRSSALISARRPPARFSSFPSCLPGQI